ncbi:uncharacterized protein [Onthophagus taurus]|uniref:uncharacterized protein n=1 Tax=Onthophagus taurus TaxID=166361 RepID=UPI0039BE6FF4
MQEQSSENGDIEAKLDIIIKQNVENRIILERIINHFTNERLNRNSVLETTNTFETVPADQFVKFKSLLQYDKMISENQTMQNQLATVFSMSGGTTSKEAIVRGLKRLISDKLARKCSLLGRKGNYEIGKMRCIALLKAAVRKRFHLTDKEYEVVVSNWLRQANLRYNRQNKETAD